MTKQDRTQNREAIKQALQGLSRNEVIDALRDSPHAWLVEDKRKSHTSPAERPSETLRKRTFELGIFPHRFVRKERKRGGVSMHEFRVEVGTVFLRTEPHIAGTVLEASEAAAAEMLERLSGFTKKDFK